jgi:hypothetical protein
LAFQFPGTIWIIVLFLLRTIDDHHLVPDLLSMEMPIVICVGNDSRLGFSETSIRTDVYDENNFILFFKKKMDLEHK